MTRTESAVRDVTPVSILKRNERHDKLVARLPFVKADIAKCEKKIAALNKELDTKTAADFNGNNKAFAAWKANTLVILKRWRDSWEYNDRELRRVKAQLRS